MFTPKENPGYNKLTQEATEVIHGWLQNNWYETSAEEPLLLKEAPAFEDKPSTEDKPADEVKPATEDAGFQEVL
jgi:hypothetical protein